jgi:hypothetical protein
VIGTNRVASLAARAAASNFSMKISASKAVLPGSLPYDLDGGGRIVVQIDGSPPRGLLSPNRKKSPAEAGRDE